MDIDSNKVYVNKQKELMSDDELISRILRSNERRVFYVDVQNISEDKVKEYVQKFKDEV